MLSFADELATKVAALIEDVGALHLVSAVGFAAEDDALFRDNRRHLSRGPWRYVEMHQDPEAREQLDAGWDAEKLVVLLPEPLPRSLIELVRAFSDKRIEVDLGDMRKRKRREDQSLVLLVNGAPDSDRIPPDLRPVACWEFVP